MFLFMCIFDQRTDGGEHIIGFQSVRVAINMSPSMCHTIITMNHPLPMLQCRTSRQTGAVSSPYLSSLNDLSVSSLTSTSAKAAPARKLVIFFSAERSHRQSHRHSCYMRYSLSFKAVSREGIQLICLVLPLR